jgi:hypothetical protein
MPTYTLRWEDKATGSPGIAVSRAGSDLGLYSPGGSWTARSLGLPGDFDPLNDRLSMFMYVGPGVFYIRRFRVEGDDASVYYGAWPSTTDLTYTAAQQDGAAGQDYIGYDSGTGAGDNAVQYSLTLQSFQAAGTGLDWYFAPPVVAIAEAWGGLPL